MTDKTATGRLRELLDGAGVAHVDYGGTTEFTGASGCACRVYARQEAGRLDVAITSVTPEQAIAATVGGGTCKNLASHQGCAEFVCSGCGTHYVGFRFNFCPNCGARVEVG